MKKDEAFPIHSKILKERSDLIMELLAGMIEENLFLKNRLSEILQTKFQAQFLEEFENLQNELVQNDEYFNRITQESHDLRILLESNLSEDPFVKKILSGKLDQIQKKIIKGEDLLKTLKSKFENYTQYFNTL
jgi:uncharacterized membrane-anchored protein YjiN (DUF445 family)